MRQRVGTLIRSRPGLEDCWFVMYTLVHANTTSSTGITTEIATVVEDPKVVIYHLAAQSHSAATALEVAAGSPRGKRGAGRVQAPGLRQSSPKEVGPGERSALEKLSVEQLANQAKLEKVAPHRIATALSDRVSAGCHDPEAKKKKLLILLITKQGVLADRPPRCANLILKSKHRAKDHGLRKFDRDGQLINAAVITATDMLTTEPGARRKLMSSLYFAQCSRSNFDL
jgi:hypothetical protein